MRGELERWPLSTSALIFRRERGRLVVALTRLFGVQHLALAEQARECHHQTPAFATKDQGTRAQWPTLKFAAHSAALGYPTGTALLPTARAALAPRHLGSVSARCRATAVRR